MSRLLLPSLLILSLLLLLTALGAGSLATSWTEVLAVLGGGGEPMGRSVILELRLPRALSAFTAGALLALAGTLMQVLLRNPLADPYVLGISGGAAAAALGVMLLGLGGAWIGLAAFGGALASTLLVFTLAHGRDGWTPTRLLLTGVVVAAGWGALISFLLAISPDRGLRGMLFWLMGDLSHAPAPWLPLAVLAVGVALATALGRPLNLLAHGGLQAMVLGAEVARLRVILYLLASLLTAAAVTLAGSIGFVGLVVPHMIRLAGVRDHRLLAPAAALAGGALVTAADTVARTAFAPRQLPVGVITAFIGVPLFLWLLNRGRRS